MDKHIFKVKYFMVQMSCTRTSGTTTRLFVIYDSMGAPAGFSLLANFHIIGIIAAKIYELSMADCEKLGVHHRRLDLWQIHHLADLKNDTAIQTIQSYSFIYFSVYPIQSQK